MQNATYFKQVAAQITAILLAALAAALFTFVQSVADQSGICTETGLVNGKAPAIAAALKGIHSYVILSTHSLS